MRLFDYLHFSYSSNFRSLAATHKQGGAKANSSKYRYNQS